MPLSPFTAHLHEQFPLAKYMQVQVAAWENQTLRLTAPLAPNVNHSDTAFGGSISTLGILAGYTLIYIALKERQISNRIMIQSSHTDFRRPIDADLTATATLPAAEQLEEFLNGLQRKRRARLSVEAQIFFRQGAGRGPHGTLSRISLLMSVKLRTGRSNLRRDLADRADAAVDVLVRHHLREADADSA